VLNIFNKLFGKKEMPFPKVVNILDNKKYMHDKEIPAEAESNGYYNCGFIELEDGRKGWMLIPMGKFNADKYRM